MNCKGVERSECLSNNRDMKTWILEFGLAIAMVLGSILLVEPRVSAASTAVANPSFEAGLSGWSHDGNTYSIGSVSNPIGVDGYSVANLGTFNQVGSYISQNVLVFPGGTYRLHYSLGANGGNSVGRVAAARLLISSSQGGILANSVNSVVSQGSLFGALGFQPFYLDFSVPLEGSVVTIRFDDVSPSNGFSVDPLIDGLRLEALFPPPTPYIITQPRSQTVAQGADVVFSVAAGGGAPLFYQWYKDLAPIQSATGSTLVLGRVTAAEAGVYWVSVLNSFGSVSSEKVNLVVIPTGNLLFNGSFENDLAAWDHDSTAIVGWGGELAQKVVNLGTFDRPGSFIAQGFQADPCSDYSLSMKLSANAGNVAGYPAVLQVAVVTQSGVPLFSNVVNLVSSSGALSLSAYQFVFNGPLSPEAAVLRISDLSPNSGVGVDVVVDDVQLVRLPSQGLESRVVPGASVTSEGPGASAVFSVPIRYQEIYSATEFGSRRIVISELRFRPDSVLTPGPFSGFLPYLEVRLSTTLRPVGQLSSRFDDNVGGDVTLVYAASWAFKTAFDSVVNGTRRFDVVIPLQRPFVYDPSQGNLLVEIKNFSPLGTRFHIDSSPATGGASRIYSDGSPSAQFASVADGSRDALELGYCYLTPIPPVIVVQPVDQVVASGSTVNFTVGALGDLPLRFQWYHGLSAVAAATNATLVLNQVISEDLGNYFVVVSNAGGSTTSSVVSLRFSTPRSTLQIQDLAVAAGERFPLRIDIDSSGKEAGLSFSVRFDPTLFTFEELNVLSLDGRLAYSVNTNFLDQGKLGVAMVLPAGQSLPAGKHPLVEVGFRVASLAEPQASFVEFGRDPVPLEVVDSRALVLDTSFLNGRVSIRAGGLEGDVSPVIGDGAVTIGDWVLMGRLVADLEKPVDELHFRKADCAPRSSLGDGALTVKDWVQIGRFVANIDVPEQVGGPGRNLPGGMGAQQMAVGLAGGAGAVIFSEAVTAGLGTLVEIPVMLNSNEPESGLGLSWRFDPSVLRFVDVRLGKDAQHALLNVNSQRAAFGSVGVVLAFPHSREIVGQNLEVLILVVEALPGSVQSSPLVFSDDPIKREIVNSQVEETPATFVDTVVMVQIPPALHVAILPDGKLELSWEARADGYALQTADRLDSIGWEVVAQKPERMGGWMVVRQPITGPTRFYKLVWP